MTGVVTSTFHRKMRILRLALVTMAAAAAAAAAAPGGGMNMLKMGRGQGRGGIQEESLRRQTAAFVSVGRSLRGNRPPTKRACGVRPAGGMLEMKVNVWDRVKIHYTARRQDGTEFDSSRTKMKP